MDNILEENDQQREPHGSTEVIVDVPEAVEQFLLPSHNSSSTSDWTRY